MMRLKVIACKVLFREISCIAAKSENYIDVTYMRQGLHNEPSLLRERLQHELDKIDSGDDFYSCDPHSAGDFDAILLAYGLCSNGIIGLSSKKYKIVVPRAHDCVTLLLGSKEKYTEYFNTHKGVYWYSPGWIDNTPMPGKERYESIRNEYVSKYGEENADYLMEMEQNWFKEYEWCTFVDWPEFDNTRYKKYSKECADFLRWNYAEIHGSHSLMADFLGGRWNTKDFLVVPPGKSICPAYNDEIICLSKE